MSFQQSANPTITFSPRIRLLIACDLWNNLYLHLALNVLLWVYKHTAHLLFRTLRSISFPDLGIYGEITSLWEQTLVKCEFLVLAHVLFGLKLHHSIPADWLFYDATKEQILDWDYRRAFISTFFSTRPTLQNCLELFRIIGHRLGAMDDEETRGLLSLLAVLMCEAQPRIKEADMVTLKESLFARPSVVKQLAVGRNTNDKVQSGLRELLQSSFDPRSTDDRRILSEVSTHWLAFLGDCLLSGEYNKVGALIFNMTTRHLVN